MYDRVKFRVIGAPHILALVAIIFLSAFTPDVKNTSGNAHLWADSEEYRQTQAEVRRAIDNGDLERAYELALPYAEAKIAEVEYAVALLMASGAGHGKPTPTMKERGKAFLYWAQRAAEHSHPIAPGSISKGYHFGTFGLPKNEILAQCWQEVFDEKRPANDCIEMQKRVLPMAP